MACITFCVHTHVVDGVLVTHTHPYSSQQHQHSPASIIAFGTLQHSLFVAAPLPTIAAVQYIFLAEICPEVSEGNPYSLVTFSTTRAPPAC